ncbi:MAG: hypothetical protein GEU74_09395, partial [Nitriliruptorales bacterium]|nr:hypothetical protein [Nitriliruptorales bacterium]
MTGPRHSDDARGARRRATEKPDAARPAKASSATDARMDLAGPVQAPGLLALQSTAGNAAVAAFVGDERLPLQRLAVPTSFSERLQQDPAPPAPGGAPATTYQVLNAGQSNRFQVTRSGDTLNINVRIKFVSNPNRQPGVADPVPADQHRAVRRMCNG